MRMIRNLFITLLLAYSLPAGAAQILLNNVSTKLTAPITNVATTVNVTAGTGVRFVAAVAPDYIVATLVKTSGFREVAWEIVRVTARSTDTLTITRAQESTTALTFSTGDTLDVRLTAGVDFTSLIPWTAPSTIGSLTPNTGAFTTLKSSGLFNVGDVTAVAGQTQLGGLISTDTGSGQNLMVRKSVTTSQSPTIAFIKSRGTAAAPSIVAASDFTLAFSAFAYDGATYGLSAQILAAIDGTPGAGSLPAKWTFTTSPTGTVVPVTRLTIDARGLSTFTGGIANGQTAQTGATYTVLDTDSSLVGSFAGIMTYTLPAAGSYSGRWLYMLRTTGAFTTVSATSNVIGLTGGAAGTAILSAAGKYAWLQSNGANWQIMAAN